MQGEHLEPLKSPKIMNREFEVKNIGTRKFSRNYLFPSKENVEENKMNSTKGFINKKPFTSLKINNHNLFTPSQATRNLNDRYEQSEDNSLRIHSVSPDMPSINRKNI